MIAVSEFADFLACRLRQLQDAQLSALAQPRSQVFGYSLFDEQPDFEIGHFEVTPVATDLKLLRQLTAVGRESLSRDIVHRLMFEIAQRRGWLADADFRPEWLL